ncbi:MAG: cytochrome c [Polyangiaceae bacterium]
MKRALRLAFGPAIALVAVACVPYVNPAMDEIGQLGSLRETMDAQAAITDAVWTKIQDRQYSEGDWDILRDVGLRIQATAERSRTWSRGLLFDTYATELARTGAALSSAVEQRENDLAAKALSDMRETCRACHSHLR